MHKKECLANALISAIENLRDNADSDFDFRIDVQNNEMLGFADIYLDEMGSDSICICEKDPLEQIDHIGKLADAVYVCFTNGAVAFSDAGLQFSPEHAPNLRDSDFM